MTFKFPSFLPKTPGTLLDAVHAQTVKRFIEAWNAVKVVRGDRDELKISDRNVVLTLKDSGGSGGYTEGDAVEVVGSDSKLVKVVEHSTATAPTAFPILLKIVDGTKSIEISYTGLSMVDATSGKSLLITFAALMRDMSIRTITMCDTSTGTTKSMDVIGSALY